MNRLLAEKRAVDEEIQKIFDVDDDDFVEGTFKPVPSTPAAKAADPGKMTARMPVKVNLVNPPCKCTKVQRKYQGLGVHLTSKERIEASTGHKYYVCSKKKSDSTRCNFYQSA